jgi:multidrug efflux pump
MGAKENRPNVMDIFVTRPVLAVVVSLLLVIAGLKAAQIIPVLQYPRIESASLVVTTPYVGASADVVQGFITEPIERVASTVPGIDYVSSTTTPGLSTVTVWLKLNEHSTDALAELSARLAQIRFELPEGAEDPAVKVQRADRSGALFYLSIVTSTYSRPEITDYLARHVTPLLSTIEGVQSVDILSGRYPAMRIWIDPARMAAFNISAEDLQNALRSNNIIATLGQSENDQQRFTLLTNTSLKTVEDFQNLIVRHADDTLIYLKDIARVELGEEEGESNGRLDQEEAVFLGVMPLPGANEIAIGDRLYELLDQINPELPEGMHITTGYDGTLYMRDAIKEIFITLVETVILVGIVVLALMGSLRTALVPLVTIPISLLGAVAAISAMGFSLNLLTILAIVLSVGLVVDDAIVVVENVSRYMREHGKTRIQAALASSRQLLSPIIGMTITLAAVYAPIGFLSGLTGMLFKEFAFTLSVAVLISGLVAITLSPIMSAYANHEGGREAPMTRWVNRRFDILHRAYGRLLEKIFLWRAQILVGALVITLFTVPFYLFSRKELAPVEDQSSIIFIVEGPPSASLEYSTRHMYPVIERMLDTPDTRYIWQLVQPNTGLGGIRLTLPEERHESTSEKLPAVYRAVGDIAGLRVFPVLPPSLPTPGRFGVEMVVQSPDASADMKPYADQLVAAAFKSGKFLFADTDLKVDMPQVSLILDRERIADLGLDMASVSRQLGVILSGNYVNRFDMNSRAYHVVPMVEGQNRSDPSALLDLQLRTPSGDLIPLSAVATLQQQVAPRVLSKFQQKNAFTIMGGVLPSVTNEQGLAVLEKAAREILPAGYTLDYSGESRQIRKEGNTLAGILGIALVFVYFVLAILFNSFRDPLVVLLGSVPLALAGAMLFPFLGWTTINIYSQIGFITLVGLIAKNGILIVEFANHLQQEGFSKLAAIKGAAETRLRPVLMTTAATALGHFPLVLVTGAGAEARNSIGIILVAGMLVGTLFTLFVLPCLYLLLAKSHTEGEADPERDCEKESAVSYAT